MYLRTTRRKNKNNSFVEYYQLAHNVRHPQTNRPTAQIIHNFGRADQLDKESLKRLCRSIARVCDLNVVETPDSNKIILEDIKLIRSFEFGTVMVIESLWEELGIGGIVRKILKDKGYQPCYERALLAMTANRLCSPESKLGVWDRWLPKVYLPSCNGLKLDQMYQALDILHSNLSEIEESIFFHVANLLNLEVDLIFYDTTSASFAIDAEDCDDLRCYGHSKEGGWSPQIVIALAVTRDGLPVKSWVFPGNTADSTTIEQVRRELRGWKLGRALFVGDSGFNSEDNRHELGKACGKYLLASRMGSVSEIKEEVLTRGGRYKEITDNLHAKEIIVGDGEMRNRYILCYNPKEADRQKKHRKYVIDELKLELSKHPSKDATAKWSIELLSSKRFKRYLQVKEGQLEINSEAIRKSQKTDGKWVLISNDDSLSLEDAACGYKGLMVIEQCFRSLKSTQLKLSPMYHWLSNRIESHVKICVLGLLLQRVAELSTETTWSKLRNDLEGLQVSQIHTDTHEFYQRNELSNPVRKILKALKIKSPQKVLEIVELNHD